MDILVEVKMIRESLEGYAILVVGASDTQISVRPREHLHFIHKTQPEIHVYCLKGTTLDWEKQSSFPKIRYVEE